MRVRQLFDDELHLRQQQRLDWPPQSDPSTSSEKNNSLNGFQTTAAIPRLHRLVVAAACAIVQNVLCADLRMRIFNHNPIQGGRIRHRS